MSSDRRPLSLRARLGLATVLLALLGLLAFGGVSYLLFSRQQDNYLRAVLRADLVRIAALLEKPQIGESFTDSKGGSFILQFVTPDDRVAFGWGKGELLPLSEVPTELEIGGRLYLATSTPWVLTGGSVRLAHDISGAMEARRRLLDSLVISGAAVALLTAGAVLLITRRSLVPLQLLARAARAVDPASPRPVAYGGPADEVGDVAIALNGSLDAIRQRQVEERAFLMEVAHELAAPLTLVAYHLSEVRRERPVDARLMAAAAAANELLRTSQDLLVLARGELERPFQFEVVDLNDLVSRAENEYPGMTVELPARAEVIGDPERLMQAVRNLVRNAIQAAGAADKVRVRVRGEGADYLVEVTDQGPGMSEETLAKAFERNFSGGRGAGVGLTVSKSLVERHGGIITARSQLGEGSCFTMALPTLESQVAAG